MSKKSHIIMNNNIVKFDDVQKHIVQIKGKDVILDYAVAELYGVQTKEINQAVRNNPRKFPKGYVFQIDNKELADLRSKFLTTNHPKSRVMPKAFTEKGLYMLATILKGDKAIETTIAIIEAFAKLRELSRAIGEMARTPDKYKQKTLMQRSGEIVEDLFGDDMKTTDTETEIELNLAVLKLRHTIKRKK
jgi:phage regulator Rha-like protein